MRRIELVQAFERFGEANPELDISTPGAAMRGFAAIHRFATGNGLVFTAGAGVAMTLLGAIALYHSGNAIAGTPVTLPEFLDRLVEGLEFRMHMGLAHVADGIAALVNGKFPSPPFADRVPDPADMSDKTRFLGGFLAVLSGGMMAMVGASLANFFDKKRERAARRGAHYAADRNGERVYFRLRAMGRRRSVQEVVVFDRNPMLENGHALDPVAVFTLRDSTVDGRRFSATLHAGRLMDAIAGKRVWLRPDGTLSLHADASLEAVDEWVRDRRAEAAMPPAGAGVAPSA